MASVEAAERKGDEDTAHVFDLFDARTRPVLVAQQQRDGSDDTATAVAFLESRFAEGAHVADVGLLLTEGMKMICRLTCVSERKRQRLHLERVREFGRPRRPCLGDDLQIGETGTYRIVAGDTSTPAQFVRMEDDKK